MRSSKTYRFLVFCMVDSSQQPMAGGREAMHMRSCWLERFDAPSMRLLR
jgi:hypothetical protein